MLYLLVRYAYYLAEGEKLSANEPNMYVNSKFFCIDLQSFADFQGQRFGYVYKLDLDHFYDRQGITQIPEKGFEVDYRNY